MLCNLISHIKRFFKSDVKLYIISVGVYLFFSIHPISGMPTIYLNENTQSIQLNQEDLEGGVSSNFVDRPKEYKPLSRHFITIEDSATTYWSRVQIVNQSPEDKEWYLISYNFNIASLDFYLEDKNQLIQTRHYGYPTSNLSDNSVSYHSPTFHLLIPKNDTCTLYLKIKHPYVAQYGFEITEHGYFFNTKITKYLVLGIFYGALLILAIYHFLFYFQLKESYYGWYGIFILFQVFYLSMRDGVALTLFFSNHSAYLDDSFRWIMLGLSTSTLLYAQHFLGLKKNKWIRMTILIFLLIRIPLNFIFPDYNLCMMSIDFSTTLISLIFGLLVVLQKRKETYVFMLSLLFIITGYLINILWHLNWIDNTKFIYETLYYTVLMEALLFSLANSYRLRRLQLQEEENVRNEFLIEVKNELIQHQNNIIQERTEALETFLYKASHDLKGPLKSIDGLCDLGKKEQDQPVVYFDMILSSSKRLQGILESLLGLAKQRSQALTISSIPLAELIDHCVQLELKEHPGMSTIQIYNNIPKEVMIKTDYYSLHSIIQNIIENAIKYQDPQKALRHLKISYQQKEMEHQLLFEDNGIGIPRKSIDRIFEMFYRANTSNSNGVGLGMYIVKQTVLLLKGQITIESKENEYTHVKVLLPMLPISVD